MNWDTETIDGPEYGPETWAVRDMEAQRGVEDLARQSASDFEDVKSDADFWDRWTSSAGEAGDLETCRVIEWARERGIIN